MPTAVGRLEAEMDTLPSRPERGTLVLAAAVHVLIAAQYMFAVPLLFAFEAWAGSVVFRTPEAIAATYWEFFGGKFQHFWRPHSFMGWVEHGICEVMAYMRFTGRGFAASALLLLLVIGATASQKYRALGMRATAAVLAVWSLLLAGFAAQVWHYFIHHAQ